MIDLRNHYGFTRTPFGKDLAPSAAQQARQEATRYRHPGNQSARSITCRSCLDRPAHGQRSESQRDHALPGAAGTTAPCRGAGHPPTPATRSGHADDHPGPQRTPGQFRKLDAGAGLAGPLLPAPPPTDASSRQ